VGRTDLSGQHLYGDSPDWWLLVRPGKGTVFSLSLLVPQLTITYSANQCYLCSWFAVRSSLDAAKPTIILSTTNDWYYCGTINTHFYQFTAHRKICSPTHASLNLFTSERSPNAVTRGRLWVHTPLAFVPPVF